MHLADRQELLACWTSVVDTDSGVEQSRLIEEFRGELCARAFAKVRA